MVWNSVSADGQSVKLRDRIIVSSWMGDPIGTWVISLIFFLIFFLYTEFTSDVSQDSGSKFLCFHGSVQYGNRRSIFLN